MDYKVKVQEILRGFEISKGVRSLNLEELAILKVAIITRDDAMIETMEKLLAEEKAGQEIDLAFLKGVVEEFSLRDDAGRIREVKEAAAKREEEAYLENLMKQFDK